MDAEDAVAAPVAADPTEFGSDLPSYEGGADGDSWAAKFSDAYQHGKKALNAASLKASSHVAPRIKVATSTSRYARLVIHVCLLIVYQCTRTRSPHPPMCILVY